MWYLWCGMGRSNVRNDRSPYTGIFAKIVRALPWQRISGRERNGGRKLAPFCKRDVDQINWTRYTCIQLLPDRQPCDCFQQLPPTTAKDPTN